MKRLPTDPDQPLVHEASCSGAIVLLNLGDGVPRSRSFDVAV